VRGYGVRQDIRYDINEMREVLGGEIMEFGILYVIGTIFLFILVLLWFFLPFAIFGTESYFSRLGQ
jgi:hypothetical protein